jgi:tRNA (guanine-N7-)-methyltransferase
VYLELGCGKGRFTLETAQCRPEAIFIAIERVPDALVIAMERVMEKGLKNVFFLYSDAMLLPEFFEEKEVSRIYINFCDPWPTIRQSKRRLTSHRFLPIYKTILKTGGEVHFKTDNQPLYEYSLEQFSENGFELASNTRNLHENGIIGVMTDYEEKFHGQGLPICRCEAVLK